MNTVIPAPHAPAVPVAGGGVFPVRRIYCVGRNYVEHAQEMGFTGREPPFFFMKPADAVVPVAEGETGVIDYPSLTKNLHHEIELVVAIGVGGRNIAAADAFKHIYGYAVGLDMTRRDLQGEAKKLGRPWCIGKGFDQSAPIGPIHPAAETGELTRGAITPVGQRPVAPVGRLEPAHLERRRNDRTSERGVDAGAGRPGLHRHAGRRGGGGGRRRDGRRHRRRGQVAGGRALTAGDCR